MIMNPHSDFIDELGGTGAVASLTGQASHTVSNWRQRDIPWRWRAKLAEVASKSGVTLPSGFLDPADEEA